MTLLRGNAAAKQRAAEILNRVRKVENPIVVEVGVNRGILSQLLLTSRPDLTLYMIDSWLGEQEQPDHYKNTKDRNAHRPQSAADAAKGRVYQMAQRFGPRAIIIEDNSVDAAKKFEEASVDLVFIDADHSYEGVKGDIEAYLPITKEWIGGHDYLSKQPEFDFSGVDKAVEEAFDDVETGGNLTWFKRVG